MESFLRASEAMRFEGETRQQVYPWMERVLCQQQYHQQGRAARGLVRRYVGKMTGLSRAQVTRLIARYGRCGRIEVAPYRRHRFPQRYTRADVELLALVDEAHENLSGPATRRILQREYQLYGKPEYARLATISVAHLYNLRRQPRYRERRLCYVKTRPTAVAIGERRPPDAQGRPGFLRIDTVHQGDAPGGAKGVYHINAVDEVTQWQIVAATPHISEAWLEPLLEAMIRQFPFRILGFHSDNGSEYINAVIARLLNRLLIQQTKSRPRHSNDNGLVESKNGAVIRKHIGYGHIASAHAEAFDQFYREHFNPYLNFHRPCGVLEMVVSEKGKATRRYPWYATPWEILRQLPDLARNLKPEVTLPQLELNARALSDIQAAQQMQA